MNTKTFLGLIIAILFTISGVALAQSDSLTNPCLLIPTRNLSIGMTAADVGGLQQLLINQGYLRIASPTNYFGPLTKAALSSWQETNNVIQPGTGFFGPLTRAKMNQVFACGVTGNLPPVLFGVAGPAILNVGVAGTWTIQARDPENLPLSYSAVWGDEVYAVPGNPAQAPQVWQNATLSHAYLTAGVYHPTFTVSDSVGQRVSTSITVTVGTGNPSPGITVTSPNGGETWAANSTQDIRWTNVFRCGTVPCSALPPANWDKVDLYLDDEGPACLRANPACQIAVHAPYVLDRNISGIGNGVYHWIVATDIVNNPIPAGDYRVRICLAGMTTNCDSSDAPFTITR